MSLFPLLVNTFKLKWLRPALPVYEVDLTGRTVIITGGNSGIGFEAAKRYYGLNPARLIIAVRTVAKGEEAKRTILQSAGNRKSQTKVEVWQLDLADFESVKRFSEKVNKELDRLDILLENAGMSTEKWSTTGDGWEARSVVGT